MNLKNKNKVSVYTHNNLNRKNVDSIAELFFPNNFKSFNNYQKYF